MQAASGVVERSVFALGCPNVAAGLCAVADVHCCR